jgi:serpin B
MFKTLKITLIPLISFCFFFCSNNPTSPEDETPSLPRTLSKEEKELIHSSNGFGFNVFKEITKIQPDSNIFISPLSISMALGMTYNGAAGETKNAMHTTLEYGDLSDDKINESYKSLIGLLVQLDSKVIFNIANSIWYRHPGFQVEEDFINVNKEYFDALVKGIDFNDPSSADKINQWIEDNTNGLIKDMIDKPIDPLTVMFLIDAIYFKGTWTYEFNEEDTEDDYFYLPDGSQIECKMMSHKNEHNYFENEKFQAIDLPYGDGLFSMTIILPKSKVDIDSLICSINEDTWNSWMKGFSKQEVTLFLPKFKIEYFIDDKLKEVLTTLGMGIAFDPGSADFSEITKLDQIWIEKVKHKTYVEVNEEGTEAAAATVVEMWRSEGVEKEIFMKINRPFIFAIRENESGTILFMGKIIEPIWEE